MDAVDIDLPEGFMHATARHSREVGEITADAFRNDPFNAWLFGKYAAIRALFHAQARRIYVPRGFSYRIGDEGAAMWMLPGGDSSLSLVDYAAIVLPTLWHCGPTAVSRALKTGEAMERQHPDFEHAYLFSIGVRAAHQGKGLGRRLIQPMLDACDKAGTRAYLENTNPANTGFYRSCGFEPMGEVRPTPDAPPMVQMVREPRSA
ncbi:GNAT family N-acetyltransferase [Qipengyuania aurantiaca]|uniref:GNAT family N-acetyltransferase n=1 Tax=Qipengyuania aurantiaca TaxID=2867233 RepID=A0ABX8ZLN2_9SPHN|nr:GNAT family N-acetyltransferase [Qipengyuania aurantiaca]QZD89915.1 GNAT family N-acetyltransferase [Qipengyuania aurantiaca]